MPDMSQGWPSERRPITSNTASGDCHSENISPHPHASAMSRKMEKSANASPGAADTRLRIPTRRSELMNVPSFSPHPAAGR